MSPGKGLAMSLIHLKPLSFDKAFLIPLAAGLAVAKSLENRGLNPKLNGLMIFLLIVRKLVVFYAKVR